MRRLFLESENVSLVGNGFSFCLERAEAGLGDKQLIGYR
jgi:hypothetical protein